MTAPSKPATPEIRHALASDAQLDGWLYQQLHADSAAANLCCGYRVEGPLHLPALRAAWLAVLDRHQALRTTLAERDDQLWQQIGPASDIGFGLLDLTGSPVTAEQRCAELAGQPLELTGEPPVRLWVLRSGPHEQLILLLAHRAIADDASMSILATDLSAAYGRVLADANQPLPAAEMPIGYADHASEARSPAGRRAYRHSLDWWRDTLAGRVGTATVTEPGRAHLPSARAGQLRFDWGSELGAQLTRFCAATASSPAAVLIAACQILLYRRGDQPAVAVGHQLARRTAATADLIGPLDNLIVLVAELADDRTFADLVGELEQLRQQAAGHAPIPFSELVRAVRPARAAGRLPLCDLVVTVADRPPAALQLAGARTERLPVHPGAISSDLNLRVEQLDGSVAGVLSYRDELFEPAAAGLLVEQLATLLRGCLRAPATPLGALPLDSPRRRHSLAVASDQLAAAVPATLPVHELVRLQAARQPENPAIVAGDRSISYRQLDQAAAGIAAQLSRLDGVAGAAVAIRMPAGPEQVAASLGALRAGAHLVWFGLTEAGERSRTVLSDLMPRCLVVTGDSADDELVRWYRDELGGSVLRISLPDPADPSARSGASSYPQLARWVYIAYTSGSTGTPKAVAQTHGAFAEFVTWMADEFSIGPGARVAQWAAPEHDPSICEVFATLVGGGTLYPVPDRIRAHPEKLLDWLAEHRISFLQTVPSFARELHKVIVGTGAGVRLASLNRLLLMGESLTGELANGLRAALPAARLANVYGPTETIAATWQQLDRPAPAVVPVGRTIPGRQVLVLDPADRPCPTGVTGEIVIRSPSVTPGYVGANPGDLAAFEPVAGMADDDRIGCYRSGDLGRWRPDGTLEFRGRMDFQVKLYGTRIELTDIEAALAEHESVAECAVAAITDQDGLVTRLVGYVLPSQPGAGSVEQWRSHLRRRLGTAVLPAAFVVMHERLPRNLAGKVDRRRLPPAPLAPGQDVRQPASWIEQDLARIWTGLLGVEPAHLDQDFFAAGGYSLLVLKFRNRVRARFGVDVPLRDCFATPTLAAISAVIASALGTANRHHAGPADREHHSVPARAF